MSRKELTKAVIIAGFVLATHANNANAEEKEYIAAVQERLYQDKHVFTVWGGWTPDEDFTVNYPVSLSYRYHLNKHIAWEAFRGTYFISQARDIKNQLIDDYGLSPEEFDYPLYSFYTSAVFKPTYGKDSVLNRWVVNHETHFSIGGGLAGYNTEYNYGDDTQELAWAVRVSAGRKYYLSKSWAAHVELEESWAFKDEGVKNNFALNLGLSYQFSREQPLSETNEELNSLYDYLGVSDEK
jgi:outer membrane beta-barrel protein